jgi:enterochelin esterase-like enzyme
MAVFTTLAVISVPALWNRVRGHAVLRLLQRVGLVLICQVTAVGLVFASVNHANTFFVTWAELRGAAGTRVVTIQGDDTARPQASEGAAPAQPTLPAPTGHADPKSTRSPARLPAGYTLTNGGAARTQVVGPASGVSGELDVWTPPGYDAHHAGGYPVILALDGYPGQPIDSLNGLDLFTAVPAAIEAGHLTASIVVSATTNVDGKNWGCADTPGGPHVGTWLTRDVPALLSRDFAVRPGARWAVLGMSEGGWCAVRLALTDPTQFAAAISLSGGNAPDAPPLLHTAADRHANDLRTLAANGTAPPVDLLLAATRQDPGTASDARALQQKAGPGVHVDLELLDHGGHNWDVWKQMTPAALTWLGARWPGSGVG